MNFGDPTKPRIVVECESEEILARVKDALRDWLEEFHAGEARVAEE